LCRERILALSCLQKRNTLSTGLIATFKVTVGNFSIQANYNQTYMPITLSPLAASAIDLICNAAGITNLVIEDGNIPK